MMFWTAVVTQQSQVGFHFGSPHILLEPDIRHFDFLTPRYPRVTSQGQTRTRTEGKAHAVDQNKE